MLQQVNIQQVLIICIVLIIYISLIIKNIYEIDNRFNNAFDYYTGICYLSTVQFICITIIIIYNLFCKKKNNNIKL